MSTFRSGIKYEAVLVAGLNNRPGDKSTKDQLELFKEGFGLNRIVEVFDWNEDTRNIIQFLNANTKENKNLLPVFLFSAGCKKSYELVKYVDKNKLFIIEPYFQVNGGTTNSVRGAVNAGVPSSNVFVGRGPSTGVGILNKIGTQNSLGSPSLTNSQLTDSTKAHWDALKVVGGLKKDVTPTIISSNSNTTTTAASTQRTTSTQETAIYQSNITTVAIGDSIAVGLSNAHSKKIMKIEDPILSVVGWRSSNLIDALKKAQTRSDVRNLILSIGSNDGWSTTPIVKKEMISQIRRVFPNAELYILNGNWGWGNLKDSATCADDCFKTKIKAFVTFYNDERFKTIGTATKVNNHPAKGDQLFASFDEDLKKFGLLNDNISRTTQPTTGVTDGAGATNTIIPSGAVANQPVSQPVSKGELNNLGEEKKQEPQRNQLSTNGIVQLFPPTIAPKPIVIPTPEDQKVQSEFSNTFGYLPFVWYNTFQIDIENVDFFSITYEGIIPVLKLSFIDTYGLMKDQATPVDNTKIKIFLNSRSEYKKPVYLQFKISSFNNYNNLMSIIGMLDVDALYYQNYKSYSDSTSNKVLQDLAKEIGIGFNTNIEETSDRMNWMNTGSKNSEFIEEVLNHAYISDGSFIGGNLDLYYNLNFVDVEKELARDLDQEIGEITNGVSEALKVKNEQLTTPLFLTSDESLRSTNYFFSSWKIINNATDVALQKGYYDDFIYVDSNSKKVHNFNLHTLNSEGGNSLPLKGGAADDEYFQSNKNYVYGGKQVEENSHRNYNFANTHNERNISEIEKIGAVIELPFPNFGLYRFQKIRILLSHNSTTLANTAINSRYSGDWIIVEIKYLFYDGQFRQVVKMIRRELNLTNEEVQAGIKPQRNAPPGRGQNLNPFTIPESAFGDFSGATSSLGSTASNVGGPRSPIVPGSAVRRVFVAAGHGGGDSGASGNSYVEKQLTLELRNLVVKELSKVGIAAIVEPDNFALNATLEHFSNQYNRNDILFDIHWNSAGPTAEGFEVFVPNGSGRGPSSYEMKLAKALVDMIAKFGFKIRTAFKTGVDGIKYENESQHKQLGWMGQNAETVLIEVCFISNSEEMKRYQQNKNDIAREIAKVLSQFASIQPNNSASETSRTAPTEPAQFKKLESRPNNQQKIAGFGKIDSAVPLSGRPLLDLMSYTEGTSGHSKNGYDVIVGYGLISNWTENYAGDHPRSSVRIERIKNSSDAAGRYQFLSRVWDEYKRVRSSNIVVKSFDKKSQDIVGYRLIINKRSIPQQKVDQAFSIAKSQIQQNANNVSANPYFLDMLDILSYEWASLPNRNGQYRYSKQGGKYTAQDVYSIYLVAVKLYS